jgi:hypothetical protein
MFREHISGTHAWRQLGFLGWVSFLHSLYFVPLTIYHGQILGGVGRCAPPLRDFAPPLGKISMIDQSKNLIFFGLHIFLKFALIGCFVNFQNLKNHVVLLNHVRCVWTLTGFVVSKTKKIQRFFLPIFKDFSKTFESNQLSKNCEV